MLARPVLRCAPQHVREGRTAAAFQALEGGRRSADGFVGRLGLHLSPRQRELARAGAVPRTPPSPRSNPQRHRTIRKAPWLRIPGSGRLTTEPVRSDRHQRQVVRIRPDGAPASGRFSTRQAARHCIPMTLGTTINDSRPECRARLADGWHPRARPGRRVAGRLRAADPRPTPRHRSPGGLAGHTQLGGDLGPRLAMPAGPSPPPTQPGPAGAGPRHARRPARSTPPSPSSGCPGRAAGPVLMPAVQSLPRRVGRPANGRPALAHIQSGYPDAAPTCNGRSVRYTRRYS